ncbi:alpha/beta fold hydrolase [Thiohalobacter sp. IOR34]|uniref:lipase family alpha/beta hydrolase n=1 Tax=Thiohalobacter sp. IOR34 TaxID=3057176 RepID=UPI0025AEFE0B|nr:alpha/beta fold hydrolase [Thiohalobacter sp. IOR34]WJW74964.1 alpha/beta fold hydrolase [Thiohalobacter sp. IOR34]
MLLIHGVWMPAASLGLLAWRLRRAGFLPRLFSYPSVRRPVAVNARRLIAEVRALGEPLGIVAHSLGGLVALRALHDEPGLPVQRLVLLGTPLRGSALARRMAAFAPGRWLLGHSRDEGLLGDARLPGAPPATGLIAGTRPLGPGRLLPGLRGPSDGTVAVAETAHPLLAARCCLPVTHSGLLLSRAVAAEAIHFLRQGRFDADGPCKICPEA